MRDWNSVGKFLFINYPFISFLNQIMKIILSVRPIDLPLFRSDYLNTWYVISYSSTWYKFLLQWPRTLLYIKNKQAKNA